MTVAGLEFVHGHCKKAAVASQNWANFAAQMLNSENALKLKRQVQVADVVERMGKASPIPRAKKRQKALAPFDVFKREKIATMKNMNLKVWRSR